MMGENSKNLYWSMGFKLLAHCGRTKVQQVYLRGHTVSAAAVTL